MALVPRWRDRLLTPVVGLAIGAMPYLIAWIVTANFLW
jgi:hypothetical protein